MKENVSKNIIPGIFFLLLGAALWLVTPGQVPTTEDSLFTARTFPYLVIAVIMLCSAALIFSGLYAGMKEKKMQAGDGAPEKKAAGGNVRLFAGVVAVALAGAVIGNLVSLLVGGLILTVGFLLLYRDKNPLHYGIVIAVVAIAYFGFKMGFGLNLP